jgi:hypothetical protein
MRSALGIFGTDASYAYGIGSSNVRDSIDATIGRSKPWVTTAMSPTFAANVTTNGGHGDVTGRAVGR